MNYLQNYEQTSSIHGTLHVEWHLRNVQTKEFMLIAYQQFLNVWLINILPFIFSFWTIKLKVLKLASRKMSVNFEGQRWHLLMNTKNKMHVGKEVSHTPRGCWCRQYALKWPTIIAIQTSERMLEHSEASVVKRLHGHIRTRQHLAIQRWTSLFNNASHRQTDQHTIYLLSFNIYFLCFCLFVCLARFLPI